MMSNQNQILADTLQKTIDLLKESTRYEWGNSGACNCGHLAQAITGFTRAKIHASAMMRDGDWTETSKRYCETSGLEVDDILREIFRVGFSIEDVEEIENLSNPLVLSKLPGVRKELQRNSKEDVILYFKTWIEILKDMNDSRAWRDKRQSFRRDKKAEIHDSIPEYELDR